MKGMKPMTLMTLMKNPRLWFLEIAAIDHSKKPELFFMGFTPFMSFMSQDI